MLVRLRQVSNRTFFVNVSTIICYRQSLELYNGRSWVIFLLRLRLTYLIIGVFFKKYLDSNCCGLLVTPNCRIELYEDVVRKIYLNESYYESQKIVYKNILEYNIPYAAKINFSSSNSVFSSASPFYKDSNSIIPDRKIIAILSNVFKSTWSAKTNEIELPCGIVPIGCCHNDFKRSNLRWHLDQLIIIDWEFMSINGLPGIDLITYYFDIDLYRNKFRNANSLIKSKRFDKIWRQYLLSLGIIIDANEYLKFVLLEKAKWLDSIKEFTQSKKYRDLC